MDHYITFALPSGKKTPNQSVIWLMGENKKYILRVTL